MKQKSTIATLAIAGAIVTTHHSTPNHTTKSIKRTNNSREITLLASQENNTIGQVANSSFLHFRTGPTTNDPIIRTLNRNQKMIILGTYGDWYKVNINGTIGYVYSYYVKIINNSTNTSSSNMEVGTLVNTTFLHLREKATIDSNIIETLYSNDKIVILEQIGSWYKVNVNGQIGYVDGYYLNIENGTDNNTANSTNSINNNSNDTENGTLINTTFLHFRTSPSIYSDVISTLNTSSQIKVLSKDDSWYEVEVDGQIGYVYGYYLQVNPSSSSHTPSSENNTNSVTQGNLGVGHLTNTTFLHFRSAASLDSDIISTLYEDSQISVIKKVGSWYEVAVNGHIGYVYGYYLSVTPSINTSSSTQPTNSNLLPSSDSLGIGTGNLINTTFLHLRDSATTDSNIIETLYDNDKITVLAKDGTWYKVSVDGLVGYVFGYYLNVNYNNQTNTSSINNNSTAINNSNIIVGQVINSSYLHVRAGAGTNFSILEDIYRGNKVEVIKKIGDWYEIKINGKIGYVFDYYLEIISGNLPNSNTTNTNVNNMSPENMKQGTVVRVSSLNIRKSPSTNSRILGTLRKNDIISIISGENGWFKILFNGQEAYVSANYISLSSPYSNAITENTTNVSQFNANGVINSYVANIRASASNNSSIIAQETLNSPVTITGETDDFYQIQLGNKLGFIFKKFISIVSTSDNETSNNITNNISKNNDTQITTNYPISLDDYVNLEYQNWPLFSKQAFINAINPQDIDNMFEFLRIDKFRNVNINKLDNLLAGKGVLSGQGQAFINACKKYKIDPVYFVNQSILETGYGRSKLAKGVTISQIAIQSQPIYDSQGQLTGYQMQQLPHPVTVYNLFGIGAEDNSSVFPNRALILGTTYAYTHGWTSIPAAIYGAADFVSSSYIHNSYYAQNTVYKLRFSPQISSIWHQYSTNIWYAKEIAELMKEHMNIYSSSDNFTYDVPIFQS